MKKSVQIFASSPDSLARVKCEGCRKALIVSSNDSFCPCCFQEIDASKSPVTLDASSVTLKAKLKCLACENTIYSDSIESNETLEASVFCPSCGSANVEAVTDEDFMEEDDTEETPEDEIEDLQDSGSDEGEEDLEGCKTEASAGEIKTEEANIEANIEVSELEASLISNPEPAWAFFHKGNLTLKLVKSKVNAEAQAIFATSQFPEIFITHAKATTLATAIKDFNAEVIGSAPILSSLDLENLAFEKLQANVIPKLQDCIALAIEGAAKGVYGDLNQELKASFFDEFVTRGMPESKVKEAIEASFISGAPVSFTAILAKATELMYKKEDSYKEIKQMIQASGPVKTVTEQDLETNEVKSKLKAGNLPLASTEMLAASILQRKVAQTSVDGYRNRIKFKK